MDAAKTLDVDSTGGTCFLAKLEKDLQDIFDYLRCKFAVDERVDVRKVLKRGSIFHKGDFFLSLLSRYVFLTGDIKSELLSKLDEISYIRECEVDDHGNLIICLNKTVLFKNVLKDVMKYEDKYGIKTSEKRFLILIHNEVFKNFDSLRIALIANHLISFLTAIGAKVSVNEYRKDAELIFKEVPTFTCSDECLEQIKVLCELIKEKAEESKWASITETESISIDFKGFLKTNPLCCWKDSNSLTIDKNLPNVVVNQGAYTLHFQHCHLKGNPDCIVHICSDSQRRKMIDSGILTEMLHLIDVPQYFITCQSTICKVQPEITIDAFMNCQKKAIELAMTHKFHSGNLKKEIWESYLKTLTDTVVKFYFFRVGTNVPMKIDLSLNQNAIKNKDGIFIQYNFARLSNLLKNFELKVEKGYYTQLPPLADIDFGLLKFEEEWNLLFFVLAFPNLVQEILWSIYSKHLFPVNRICIMLIKLCSCFSVYYSRIHILGGPQPKLQKVMHARLWLLKGVHQIMHNSFILLNIEGLNKM